MELKIEYLPIKALKPYEKNTRKHQKKDVDNIAKSIEKYGMCDAIGIWGEQNIIVEGHGRMLACKQLGMAEVPCVRLDHLTDEQRREYAIAHNATAELSEWDLDILPDELAELDLSDFDFDFGFSVDEEEYIEEKNEEAEELPTDKLPESRIFVFAVSAFGTKSECFVQAKLSEEEAEKFLQRFEEVGASATAERLREALNGL